ncbi:RHS repeat domain-containing protein [Microbulbifer sp. ZKSA002]|uniref:RHS repeat domain-containing protein n=1 Tax=Microbulbifer sp. ZKSA002 TaxID=3243388 RepID=UPI004039B76C
MGSLQPVSLDEIFIPDEPSMDSAISPLDGSVIFGERYDPFTGRISFIQTDIDIPGNFDLPVRISRTKLPILDGVAPYGGGIQDASFVDWRLDIPILAVANWEKFFKYHDYPVGVSEYNFLGNFCSEQKSVPFGYNFQGTIPSIYVNGQQKVLKTISEDNKSLYPDGANFVTDDHWVAFCIPIDNSNMGMKILSPNGDTYNFDTLAPNFKFIYASSIVDAHGNIVEYNNIYKKAGSISASDGRIINITREAEMGRVTKVSANGKTWNYEYAGSDGVFIPIGQKRLKKVIRPDGKYYQFLDEGIDSIDSANELPYYWYKNIGKEFSISLIHPDGAKVVYEMFVGFIKTDNGVGGLGDYSLPEDDIKCSGTIDYRSPTCGIEYFAQLKKKTVELDSGVEYEWVYDYFRDDTHDIVQSTIHGPSNVKKYEYSINQPGVNWAISPKDDSEWPNLNSEYLYGSLIEEGIYSLDGQALITKKYSYYYLHNKNLPCALSYYKSAGIIPTEPYSPYLCVTNVTFNALGGARYDLYKSNLKKIVTNLDGTNYIEEYSNYDDYGNYSLVESYNSYHSDRMYRKYSFQKNLLDGAYFVGVLQSVFLSQNGLEWKEYLRYIFDDKYEIQDIYQYGGLVSSITERHDNGLVKKVVYGGDSERWRVFKDFFRGKPKVSEFPNRYDSGSSNWYQEINGNGNLKSTTDGNGNKISYDYDLMDRLSLIDKQASFWDDESAIYRSSKDADPIEKGVSFVQEVSRGSYKRETFYDQLYRPVLIREIDTTDVSGTQKYVRREFNAENKEVFVSYPSKEYGEPDGVKYSYDGLGRMLKRMNTADSSKITYSYEPKNTLILTDQNGNKTSTQFLAYGTPNSSIPLNVSSPENLKTNFSYNLFGKIEYIDQGDNQEVYFYDDRQRLCKSYRPETNWSYFSYNANNEVIREAHGVGVDSLSCDISVAPDELVIKHKYDNRGDLWVSEFGDGTSDVEYIRDDVGNLTNLKFDDSSWAYTYNSINKLESETLKVDNKEYVLDPEYDSMGYMISLAYPSGRKVDFTKNSFGQTTRIDKLISNVSYYPSGGLDTVTYVNGLKYTASLNELRLPSDIYINNVSGELVSELAFVWDKNSNIKLIQDLKNSKYTIDMVYDGLNRLREANGYWGEGSIEYSTAGNITSKSFGDQSLKYYYDSKNRLDKVSGSEAYSFSYDSRGNVESNGRRKFIYNLFDQLVISDDVEFSYDGHGRRTKKIANGMTTLSLYGLDGLLFYQQKPNGDEIDYIYLNGQLISRIESR